jgi:CRISPR-associated protein Cmr4
MQRAYFIHALSPLHAGTGQAQGVIDLPIARLRGTGIPYLPGSSIKGVLRDAQERGALTKEEKKRVTEVFGPPVDLGPDEDRYSGAIAFGDARLLALPVRSFYGTFAWVTSPLLLRLARRDLAWEHLEIPGDFATGREPWVGLTKDSALAAKGQVFFEEIETKVNPKEQDRVDRWAEALGTPMLGKDAALFAERLAVIDDETMTYLWECCTQVDARVRIDRDRGVVQEDALWYEESLPAESILLGVAVVIKGGPNPQTWLDACLGQTRADLQFGGKATVGRGRARLIPVPAAQVSPPGGER